VDTIMTVRPTGRGGGRRWLMAVMLACAAVAGRADAATGIRLDLVAGNLPYLVDIQHNGTPDRLFLVGQQGSIRILDGATVRPTPFLDVSSLILFAGERGLLGLAFHPSYATNRVFFIHYTNTANAMVLARYQVSASDPNVADPDTAEILLTVPQPFGNHKGGQIRFGPDGYLYVALGDGGAGGDPQDHGQNLSSLLGKLLRLDIDGAAPYAIPAGNPFVSLAGARPEIWATGLRNPWRFSFDRATGDLFIADVGQNGWEEINQQPAAGGGGRNYGWRRMEGRHCFNPASGCQDGTLVEPIIEYSHAIGCSTTGGFRYRGSSLAGYGGTYVFSDYCNGIISGAAPGSQGTWTVTQLLDTPYLVSTFGEDATGELYMATYGSAGQLHRLAPAATAPARLAVSLVATAAGRVTSTPALLDCGDTCAAELTPGTVVSLTATPEAGATFVGWAGADDCLDGSVTVTADLSCTARFGVAFTDQALTAAASFIRAVHVTELRTRINALRRSVGLADQAWTTPVLTATVTVVHAVHVAELRTALAEAFTAAARTPPGFTDAGPPAGAVIKAVHVTELRAAVLDLELNLP